VKRLLLDQGLPRSTAALLTQAGWNVIHVSEIGMSRADDRDILQRAGAEARICVTLDAGFHSLSGDQR
jgi:predicted nuclease of predicted toxin-antitoxin system